MVDSNKTPKAKAGTAWHTARSHMQHRLQRLQRRHVRLHALQAWRLWCLMRHMLHQGGLRGSINSV